MLTKGAIEDLITEHLSRKGRGGAAPARKLVPELKKRTFISDWDLRRVYAPGSGSVRVPANAIISPLSRDWLDFDGIKVITE
jgi:hypothetical protein